MIRRCCYSYVPAQYKITGIIISELDNNEIIKENEFYYRCYTPGCWEDIFDQYELFDSKKECAADVRYSIRRNNSWELKD